MTANLITWIGLAALVFYIVAVASCVVVVVQENRNPIRSLSWVVALIFLPIVGIVFYLFFGRSPKLTKMARQHRRRILSAMSAVKVDLDSACLSPWQKRLVKLAANISASPLTLNNRIEIFSEGLPKFEALKRDLLAARKYILLQYYIFSDDALGHEISEILKQKAAEGVVVKVIYDHVGSFSTRSRFFKEMRRAGVDAQPFFRVTFPQLANRINWRNHRKMVIIDNRVAYLGGMNIASRYVDGFDHGVWRDTHFRLQGEIVHSIGTSFALDWNFMNRPVEGPLLHQEKYTDSQPVAMQLVTSGPTDEWSNISMCFLSAIASARKCVYIETPYFLPTEALLTALETAALSGIDVRLVIPRKPDSRMIKYASFSYVTKCLEAGIKVYLYEPGMLHSKNMIIDHEFVTSGSTNFDFRSFENNFECNLLIYNGATADALRTIFFEDVAHSTRVRLPQWRRRPLMQRALESIMRLVAPVL